MENRVFGQGVEGEGIMQLCGRWGSASGGVLKREAPYSEDGRVEQELF